MLVELSLALSEWNSPTYNKHHICRTTVIYSTNQRIFKYLDGVEAAGELGLVRDTRYESVVVLLEGEGREVALRVAVPVDPDVVAGNALVPAHPYDSLRDLATYRYKNIQ